MIRGRGAFWAALFAVASPASATDALLTAAPPGALACGGCHGTNSIGGAPPRIAGRPSAEIVAALTGFRSGERSASVMGRIARGFSPDEDRAIAAWLEGQR